MMNEIILSYLKWAFIISAILYVTIFVSYIVPTIRLKRKVHWSDWLGLNFNWFSYLNEYKEICIEKGIPLFFRQQVSSIVSAPSEAWCILQGESPCRVRVSHPPVSSLACVAEPKER